MNTRIINYPDTATVGMTTGKFVSHCVREGRDFVVYDGGEAVHCGNERRVADILALYTVQYTVNVPIDFIRSVYNGIQKIRDLRGRETHTISIVQHIKKIKSHAEGSWIGNYGMVSISGPLLSGRDGAIGIPLFGTENWELNRVSINLNHHDNADSALLEYMAARTLVS